MNLDIFNNLIKSTKENEFVQNFIKELGDALANNLNKGENTQIQSVQIALDGKTLTTSSRDEINLQRSDIVNNYSIEKSKQEELYYVYSKNSDNTYGVVMHKDGNIGNDIWVKESELPKDAGVDTVLRLGNGKYVLDKEATAEIQEELVDMINKVLKEQENKLENYRVEGHIYNFVEKTGDSVWLVDETENTGDCFEEIDFPSELSDMATQGSCFRFANGEYELVNNK